MEYRYQATYPKRQRLFHTPIRLLEEEMKRTKRNMNGCLFQINVLPKQPPLLFINVEKIDFKLISGKVSIRFRKVRLKSRPVNVYFSGVDVRMPLIRFIFLVLHLFQKNQINISLFKSKSGENKLTPGHFILTFAFYDLTFPFLNLIVPFSI